MVGGLTLYDIFISYLEGCLEDFDLPNKDVYIFGDINIDVLDKKHDSTKKLTELLSQTGLTNYIREPTRFTIGRNSCLDHIYSNSTKVFTSGVLDVNISDHEMVYIVHKKLKSSNVSGDFKGRSYRNHNRERFVNDLTHQDWGRFFETTDPNQLWPTFHGYIMESINPMCPLKTFKIRKFKEIWVTNEILELIKDKDAALHKAKRTNSETHWTAARRLRNNCVAIVRKAKSDFIKNELNENITDSKKFWKQVKEVIPNGGSSQNKISLIDDTTGLLIEEKCTADFINDFFTNIGPTLAKDMNTPWDYNGRVADRHLHDIFVNREEIEKFCKEIEITKASSIENISSRILKDAFLSQIDKLHHLFKQIFTTGNFPDTWKYATVIPLKKCGNSNLVTNLRPISLLPLPSKIIEKIIHNRMIHHLEINGYLDANQGGFRKDNSTINTTVKFTNDIFNAINSRQVTLSTFIDMAKAFDTVNHEILVKKLIKLGFTGTLLALLRNYLANRQQCTIANGITSKSKKITCGIPQGSTVGPLLFILYMNDISSILTYCKYQLYADDTVLYMSGQVANITDLVNDDLAKFKYWCLQNKLTINVKKTKCVYFGLKSQVKNIDNHRICIDNMLIDRVNSYKYLGVTLDATLNYNAHLSNCLSLASHKIFLLSKIRKYITFEAANRIYKTMILPIVEYGDILYDGSSQKLLGKLQTLQNRGLRLVYYRQYHVPVIALHEISGIAKLSLRRQMHLLLYMYKQKSNVSIVNSRVINTRLHDALVFISERPNNEKYKNNVLYKGPLLWNSRTVDVRNIQSYDKLKSYLKKEIFDLTVPNRL